MRSMLRSMTALVCVFLSVNALATTSATLASQGISQAIAIGNDEVNGKAVTGAQFTSLANKLNSYITAATNDGTLTSAQTYIANNAQQIQTTIANDIASKNEPNPLAATIYGTLNANGWVGTQTNVEIEMAQLTAADVTNSMQQIQTQGLASALQGLSSDLETLAQEAKNQGTRSDLVYTSFHGRAAHLIEVECAVMAEFLAIGAIGAIASLGGVNPLGDLLVTIGTVGGFVCYVIH